MGSNVVIVLSTEGVRTLDSLTRSVINNIFVQNISYTCVADRGQSHEIFACITYDERLERSCCFVYHCVAGQADQICDQVQYAMESSHNELDDEGYDPFSSGSAAGMPTVQSRVEVPPHLLKYHVHREYLAAVKPVAVGQFGKIYFATYAPPDDDDEGSENGQPEQAGVEFRAVKLLRTSATATNRSDFLKAYK